jgi:hypothetical protein
MNITIEKTDSQDAAVVEMWEMVWKERIENGYATQIPSINAASIFFIIKDDDTPVGIRAFQPLSSDFYNLYLSYVKEEYRTPAITIQTYNETIDEVKKLGVKRITTNVLSTSTEMIQNFKDLGIEPVAYRYEFDI